MQAKMSVKRPSEKWPEDGLEAVPFCPACGSEGKRLLYEGLEDRIFFCAPGKWSMYNCTSCGSAYLDPRPTINTIGLAYETYYTHKPKSPFSSLGFATKIRRLLANGYRNYRYGTKDYPASFLGVLAAALVPSRRAVIDAEMRHLPPAKNGMRLLDFGCGNGDFLRRAKDAGWEVLGIDLDENAVNAARRQGLNVRLGDIDILDPTREQFDIITLSHVIEHVHYPVALLKDCYSLTKPGGYIWLDTPNIQSRGHELFKEHWRGLEPPRHLAIFTLDALQNALRAAGFTEIEIQPYSPICADMFMASQAILEGSGLLDSKSDGPSADLLRSAERKARRDARSREFLTLAARKR